MIPEDVKTRRGEPVIVRLADGRELPGYIEFGDETTRCISVACEPGGARVIVYQSDVARCLRTDPGGARPLRDARGIVWAGAPARDARTYLLISPRIERIAADYLRKYGDGRSEALSDLQQLLMAERERGLRDAVRDVCAWLRAPDPELSAVFAAAKGILHSTADSIAALYLRGSQVSRLMREDPVKP